MSARANRYGTWGEAGKQMRDVPFRVQLWGPWMDAITYSAARANLASVMDRVCDDHEALIITRNGEQSVVMLSLADYDALEETT